MQLQLQVMALIMICSPVCKVHHHLPPLLRYSCPLLWTLESGSPARGRGEPRNSKFTWLNSQRRNPPTGRSSSSTAFFPRGTCSPARMLRSSALHALYPIRSLSFAGISASRLDHILDAFPRISVALAYKRSSVVRHMTYFGFID